MTQPGWEVELGALAAAAAGAVAVAAGTDFWAALRRRCAAGIRRLGRSRTRTEPGTPAAQAGAVGPPGVPSPRPTRRPQVPQPSMDQYSELAERGAVQLAAAMTTEQWPGVREAAQRMFAFVERERCAVLVGELDQDKNVLTAAAVELRDPIRGLIVGRWEARLVELLAAHAAVQDELADLLGPATTAPAPPRVTPGVVNRQSIVAGEQGVAIGAQNGDVHYHAAGTPTADQLRREDVA
jgi:hypothetical protein